MTALVLWAPAWAQALLSPVQFRDAAIAMIEARAPDTRVEVTGDLSLHVVRSDNHDMQVNLDRGGEYQNDPASLETILDRWARLATSPPDDVRRADRIVAVVRPRGMVTAYEQYVAAASPDAMRLVTRPLAGDLLEVLVFDSEEAVQYASEQALAEIGLSIDQAWMLAPQNLPARLGEIEVGGVQRYDSWST